MTYGILVSHPRAAAFSRGVSRLHGFIRYPRCVADQEQGSAFYTAQTPDGETVVGVAQDEAHAMALIESMQRQTTGGTPLYTCNNPDCNRAVGYSIAYKRWYHALDKGHPTKCPGLETNAFPAPPKSRDRKAVRGVWTYGDNTCGPDE